VAGETSAAAPLKNNSEYWHSLENLHFDRILYRGQTRSRPSIIRPHKASPAFLVLTARPLSETSTYIQPPGRHADRSKEHDMHNQSKTPAANSRGPDLHVKVNPGPEHETCRVEGNRRRKTLSRTFYFYAFYTANPSDRAHQAFSSRTRDGFEN